MIVNWGTLSSAMPIDESTINFFSLFPMNLVVNNDKLSNTQTMNFFFLRIEILQIFGHDLLSMNRRMIEIGGRKNWIPNR